MKFYEHRELIWMENAIKEILLIRKPSVFGGTVGKVKFLNPGTCILDSKSAQFEN